MHRFTEHHKACAEIGAALQLIEAAQKAIEKAASIGTSFEAKNHRTRLVRHLAEATNHLCGALAEFSCLNKAVEVENKVGSAVSSEHRPGDPVLASEFVAHVAQMIAQHGDKQLKMIVPFDGAYPINLPNLDTDDSGSACFVV